MKRSSFVPVLLLVIFACNQPRDRGGEKSTYLFNEPYRPQYHFTPPAQWMNDPNGMVYYEGEYHLFYQHYPDSNVWGPMHWGHAVSTDMINWDHLPIALYPDSLGYIFSGSAVIDWNNTSGLGTVDNSAMVAIYTYHDPVGAEAGRVDYQTQGIAYSLDKGRSWTKYENNPVLDNPGIIDFRDPKVAWDEDYKKWVMTLAVKDHIEFYASPDLINWKKESEFGKDLGAHGGVWECPDLFALKDQEGNEKWVLLVSINPGGPQGGSATQYFVGDFDGSTFTPADTTTRWIDHGADNYAGVTWSDIPAADGRRLFLGWMSNWQYANEVPTYEWRSAMTLPRELLLKNTGAGYILQSKPVAELRRYLNPYEVKEKKGIYTLKDDLAYVSVSDIGTEDLMITISNDRGDRVVISIDSEKVFIDRTHSGKTSFHSEFGAVHAYENFLSELHQVEVYIDRSSIELFINDGEFVMTDLVFPSAPYAQVAVEPSQNTVSISDVASIWKVN